MILNANTLGMTKSAIDCVRIQAGRPILTPQGTGWESGFTCNPAVVLLTHTDHQLIKGLLKAAGITSEEHETLVVVFYRAQPISSPGFPDPRSSVGLALFTSDFRLIHRFSEPLLSPSEDSSSYDHNGVEDPRVTRIGDIFYMYYCGFTLLPGGAGSMQICLARSTDLIHWDKSGPVTGDVNANPNKDAVLFPELVDGNFMLLHRPMSGKQSEYSIELAVSPSPEGPWKNTGKLISADPIDGVPERWVGAGPTPLPLGDDRYLVFYHTGTRLESGEREYVADAAILDLNRFSSIQPEMTVEAVVERILVPETEYEQNNPARPADILRCVFPCGAFYSGNDIYLTYGGGDTYVLAACFSKDTVLRALKSAGSFHNRSIRGGDLI